MKIKIATAGLMFLLLTGEYVNAGKPGPSTPPPTSKPTVKYSIEMTQDGPVSATNLDGVSLGSNRGEPYLGQLNGARLYLNDIISPEYHLTSAWSLNDGFDGVYQIAGKGTKLIDGAWINIGYRLSIIPDGEAVIDIIEPTLNLHQVEVWGPGCITQDGRVVATRSGSGLSTEVVVLSGTPGAGVVETVLSGPYPGWACINLFGQIGGWTRLANGDVVAYRYTPGEPLRTYGPLATWKGQSSSKSQIRAINDSGLCVGEALALKSGSSELRHAAAFSDMTQDLGTVSGTSWSTAACVNNYGTVAGICGGTLSSGDGFVSEGSYLYWLKDVLAASLPTNVESLKPRHINDSGVISGIVSFNDGSLSGGFVMTPIPNP